MKKRGTILVENVIFITLNILFLVILVIFIARQGGGAIVLEQSYAKQIALLVDSAKPGMVIILNMEKGYELAQENKIDFKDVINVTGNVVTVKLSEQGGYSYSFFNNIDLGQPYFEKDNDGKANGNYVFTVDKRGTNE